MPKTKEEKFLNDIQDHELEIYRDDGIDRHLKFRKPNTIHMWFDIITWNQCLLITGDMGTYLFRRVEDMFRFFRPSESAQKRINEAGITLYINPGYWGEKVQAIDRQSDIKEWSMDNFEETIKEWFKDWYADQDLSEKERQEIWHKVEMEVFRYADNPSMAMHDAMAFTHDGQSPFQNSWDVDCREYTYHFIWCCYAIVWGIEQYDQQKSKQNSPDADRNEIIFHCEGNEMGSKNIHAALRDFISKKEHSDKALDRKKELGHGTENAFHHENGISIWWENNPEPTATNNQ